MATTMHYYLDYNKNTEEMFLKNNKHLPSLSEFRKISPNVDGSFDINPLTALNIGRMTYLEYAQLMRKNGGNLGVIIDKDAAVFYHSDSILQFTYQNFNGVECYNRVDSNVNNYILMDRDFRNEIDEGAYRIVTVTKDPKKVGYNIEFLPENLGVKLNIIDKKLKSQDIYTGVYISVNINKLKRHIRKYLITYSATKDGSFVMTNGFANLLSPTIRNDLNILEKNQYYNLIKKSYPVGVKWEENGKPKIRLVSSSKPPRDDESFYYLITEYERFLIGDKTISESILGSIDRVGIGTNNFKDTKNKAATM